MSDQEQKNQDTGPTISGDLLRQVDEQAEAIGTGRSAFIYHMKDKHHVGN